ncbi:MAG TPA: J domain-containing protein, partial [Candidatus Caenarcaniphilales bacterium]
AWRNRGKAPLAPTYYTLLGLHPLASVQQIRRAYREKSKHYHPDTTDLPAAIAVEKFQQLNEAYATLSNVERRLAYDQKIGFSRAPVIQTFQSLNTTAAPQRQPVQVSSAYLDYKERPLSPGELFALFILGVTFLACLLLALTVGLTRGETAFRVLEFSPSVEQPVILPQAPLLTPDRPIPPVTNHDHEQAS